MNERDLMDAVGQIGDDLVEEGDRKRYAGWLIFAAAAACLALIFGLGFGLRPAEKQAAIAFTETDMSFSIAKSPYPEGAYSRTLTEGELAAFLGLEDFGDWEDQIPSGTVHYEADGRVWKVTIGVGEGFDWMRLELAPGAVPLTDVILMVEPKPQDYFGTKLTAISSGERREAWGLMEGAEVIGVRISGLGENAEDRINCYAALTLGRNGELSLAALEDQ